MRNVFCAALCAFMLTSLVYAEKPADAPAVSIFADAPNVIPLKAFEKLPLRAIPGKYIGQEASVRQQLQQRPGDKALALKLAGIEEMKANAQAGPVGVFLSQPKFRLDQPAYAYFVVRNTTGKPLELDMRLDLHAGDRTINSCIIELRRVGPDEDTERVAHISAKEWHCGGPALVRLQAGGVYCVRADLRKLGVNAPGRYTLQWRRRDIASQRVSFEMLPGVRANEDQPHSVVHVAKISTAPREQVINRTGRLPDPPPPLRIAPAVLQPLPAGRFAATLATGVAGNVYPDIRDLPSSDKFITATATLEEAAGETQSQKLTLSLTPKQRNQGLYLESYKHVYLIATSTGPQQLRQMEALSDVKQLEAIRANTLSDPARPLNIEIQLPAKWHHSLGVSGEVKLCVLISSERLKLQGGYPQLEALMMKESLVDQHPWQGLLCTPAIKVKVPQSSSQ